MTDLHAPSPKAKYKQNPRRSGKGRCNQKTPNIFVLSDMSAMDAMTATNDKYQMFPIIWDAGASYTIMPEKDDFSTTPATPPSMPCRDLVRILRRKSTVKEISSGTLKMSWVLYRRSR